MVLLKKSVIGFYKSHSIHLDLPVWFLIVLFYTKLLFALFDKQKIWIALLLWGVGFFVTRNMNHFFVGQAIMALPLYALGYYFKDKYISMSTRINYKWLLVVPLLALIVYFLSNTNGVTSMNLVLWGNLTFPLNIICFYIVGVAGSCMMMIISSIPKKGNHLVIKMAESLITILGLQWLFIEISHLLGLGESFIQDVIISLIITILCYYSHLIIMRLTPQLLGKSK